MRLAHLLLLLPLTGCGGLPQPFFGQPGRDGARLAEPPPSRLAVLTPSESLLTDAGSAAWAETTAAALVDQGLPAGHNPAHAGDWRLRLVATMRGTDVVPTYELIDSTGKDQGRTDGAPVAASEWSRNDPAVLKVAAEQAAPAIDALLTRIEAARLHNDPNSLQNRPARVYMAGVEGAPGDGDRSLDTQIRLKLAAYGIVIQDTATGADYQLHCEVRASPAPNGNLKVELAWIVDDHRGERGKVTQLNEVPVAAVSSYWGDVAVVAAEQAAGGIKDVLFNAAGPRLSDGPSTPSLGDATSTSKK